MGEGGLWISCGFSFTLRCVSGFEQWVGEEEGRGETVQGKISDKKQGKRDTDRG